MKVDFVRFNVLERLFTKTPKGCSKMCRFFFNKNRVRTRGDDAEKVCGISVGPEREPAEDEDEELPLAG